LYLKVLNFALSCFFEIREREMGVRAILVQLHRLQNGVVHGSELTFKQYRGMLYLEYLGLVRADAATGKAIRVGLMTVGGPGALSVADEMSRDGYVGPIHWHPNCKRSKLLKWAEREARRLGRDLEAYPAIPFDESLEKLHNVAPLP
jgi:hypothetical protein